jgi:hypothetical protein
MKQWSRKYSKCIICKTTKYIHKANGFCTSCYDKKRYIDNPNCNKSREKYKNKYPERIKNANKKYHAKKRQELFDLLGNKCCRCGFSDKRALQIDHINGGGRLERIKYNTKDFHRLVLLSLKNKENKYQLLCANCNWIKRTENREWGE